MNDEESVITSPQSSPVASTSKVIKVPHLSPKLPPMARLPSLSLATRFPSSPTTSPTQFLDSLTRALPSSSISSQLARHPDFSKPTSTSPQLHRSLSSNSQKSGGVDLVKLGRERSRSRSASLGSLNAFVNIDASSPTSPDATRRRRGSFTSGSGAGGRSVSFGSMGRGRRTSRDDVSTALEAIDDDVSEETASDLVAAVAVPKLSDLSWSNAWWPFAVVEPEEQGSGKGKQKALDQDRTGEDPSLDLVNSHHSNSPPKQQTRSFLEYFAGKGAVEDAKALREEHLREEAKEGEMLDKDLNELLESATSGAVDDEVMGQMLSKDSQLPPIPPKPPSPTKPTSFLPTSMFSSTNSLPTTLLDGPSSLFSSFSLPTNPFAPSTSPTSRTSQPMKPPHHGRAYSSGPGTERKQVEGMLDEEDKKKAKIEDDSHMDMFTLIKERYKCPKYPIVFCHGLFGFDTIGPAAIKPLHFSYWVGVKEALEVIGVEVLIGRVPASASIEDRAKVLCEQIEQTFPGREVNLIGHSMGGLDGRFVISRLKPTTFKVRSLTTISTPHRGSSFSNFLLEDILGTAHVPALQGLLGALGVPGGGAAFNDLTTTKMEVFNEETPNDPGVKYYSYGAEFEPGWSNVFRVSWGIIHEREGPNDGLVSVESSKWGEYKATLTNVNHLDLVGWVGKVRYGWAEWLGKPIKFRPVSFYLALAEMLADEEL